MKVQNIQNHNTFKGFKNIVAYDYNTEPVRLMYMTMQLDNIGVNDLDKLMEYRKLSDRNKCWDDSVALVYTRVGNVKGMSVDNVAMYWGDELKQLAQKAGDDTWGYRRLEKETLFLCTFLANLTKRISNCNELKQNFEEMKVVAKRLTDLMASYGTAIEKAAGIASMGIKPNRPIQAIAHSFNLIIDKSMKKLFI